MKFRLKIVTVEDLDIKRHRVGRNFTYRDAAGNRITDPSTKARIRALAIPPAYTDVRIASDERAHIQAVGHDEAGRWQYRYHPEWTVIREDRKAARLLDLLSVLPRIRAAVIRDMASRRLDRSKAIACAVALIVRGTGWVQRSPVMQMPAQKKNARGERAFSIVDHLGLVGSSTYSRGDFGGLIKSRVNSQNSLAHNSRA